MKDNLFIELAGVRTKKEFDVIIAKQEQYDVLSDWYTSLFNSNSHSRLRLQTKVVNLLEILDLWNYTHESEKKFWTLKDAVNPLQQIEIPIRNFIKTFAKLVSDDNWEAVSEDVEYLSVITNLCAYQSVGELYEEDERQRELLSKLAYLSKELSDATEDKSPMQILGRNFAQLFLALSKDFDVKQVSNAEYELNNFQKEGFLSIKTLIKLGFNEDVAIKLADYSLALADNDKSKDIFKLFEHPSTLSQIELARLRKEVAVKKGANTGTISVSSTAIPVPPTMPLVKNGPLSCAFLSEKRRSGSENDQHR